MFERLVVALLPHASFISMVMLQIHCIVQAIAGHNTTNVPLNPWKPESVTLWNNLFNQKRRHKFLHKCKCWQVFPMGPHWPADHGQLQIRNTQVEKKPFYACPRCQSANSECNPTCNTCSSTNYRVIPAGQNLANFCKVGIGSDFEANFLERPNEYFVFWHTLSDVGYFIWQNCLISKLRASWGSTKANKLLFPVLWFDWRSSKWEQSHDWALGKMQHT